jgi:hypothetical protein
MVAVSRVSLIVVRRETSTVSNLTNLHELPEVLGRVIRELPEPQREVIDLAFFQGDESARDCCATEDLPWDHQDAASPGRAKIV